ncbi:MAG: NTP transferase domain-containing protein [Nanoarchaeota archaeon]|nr:NTP transferase domain-containing protein [Nanoarchaeota archaeon]
MKVIIPLAGKGSRMRPHTHTKAKPLLHIAGRPMMSYILDEVMKLKPTGIYFATGHLKEQVEAYINKNYDFNAVFIEQKVKDGTAGAINMFKDVADDEPILIIFVDTLFDCDMSILTDLREDGILWAKEVEDYQRFGVMVTDKNGILTKIVEKPTEPVSKLANIGLYYIKNPKVMFECIKELYDKNMKTKGEYYLTDAFQMMVEKGQKLKVVEVEGWYDCGKPETTLETSRVMLQKREDALKKKKLDPITGGKNATIENSVIIPPCAIEEGVVVKDSIIGPYVSIASGTKIERSVLADSMISADAELKNVVCTHSIIGEGAKVERSPKKLNVGDHSELDLS